ncbi:MAG: V-type ATP synthase subunit I [Bacillota bacterium]
MPIIEMKKVFLLGHRQERESIFNLLHNLGSVELMDIKSSKAWDDYEALVEPEHAGETLSQTETTLSELRYCLDFLHRYYPVKKSFVEQFTGSKLDLTESDFNDYIAHLEQAHDVYNSCHDLEEKMASIRNEETQTKNLIEELEPWSYLSVPLEELGRNTFTVMGLYTVPIDSRDSLQASLAEKVPTHYFEQISSGTDYGFFFFAGLNEEEEYIQEVFKENTVSAISFPGMTGTASENIENLYKKSEELNSEREAVLKEVEALLEHRPMLMACYDYISNEVQKHEAVTNLARTENSFLLEGWVPAPVLSDLKQVVDEKTETAVLTSRDPEPDENVPVLLHNQGPIEAYEVVTKLYSTPRRSELDPTPYMAPFFFVFFGICLSDAGYGIILSLLAIYVSRKLKLEGMGKQLIYLLFLGGISALVFGVLFGGYFGDLIKLPPLWFNPLDEPMRMLFYCFGIGLFHVYFGMAVQAYRNIKAGQPMSAVYDQGFWFLFINGLIMMMALPELETVGQWLTIAAGAGLVLSQGRHQSGIVMKFMSGLLSLYNITGYLSDVLSYSRLLALGLASIVIATAINAMSEMVGGTVVGTVIMILVLLGGHAFNIIISTLSSYVHTSRLQYIEFFSKFFEGGGKAF